MFAHFKWTSLLYSIHATELLRFNCRGIGCKHIMQHSSFSFFGGRFARVLLYAAFFDVEADLFFGVWEYFLFFIFSCNFSRFAGEVKIVLLVEGRPLFDFFGAGEVACIGPIELKMEERMGSWNVDVNGAVIIVRCNSSTLTSASSTTRSFSPLTTACTKSESAKISGL